MEWIRAWVLGITCAAMIAALLQAFLPKGGIGRAGRLAAGLLVMLAAVGPLAGVDYDSLAQTLSELRLSRSEYAQELALQNGEILKAVIEQETEAYILDKANEIGVDCQVEVTCAEQEGETPYPARARITGELTESEKRRLTDALEADLGIPAERQEYIEEVE